MTQTVLTHRKGSTYGNYTINCKINDKKNSTYNPNWANTGNTKIEIYDESDDTTIVKTVQGANIVNITTSTIVFKKSSIDDMDEGHYIAKVVPGDGTFTDEGEFELKVVN